MSMLVASSGNVLLAKRMRHVIGCRPHAVWLNPTPERDWNYTASIRMIRTLLEGRMFPLTLGDLGGAMRELVR